MATTTVGRTTIQGATTVGGFNPATLFSAGEQGVWYDPSDLSTLFQDSAGTIPVTALEQPVGRMLDKSGRGNHATQSTNTSFRPVVSARVNLLTYTQTFASGWSSPPSATSETLAPDGTSTASKIILSGATQTFQGSTFGTGLFTGSIYVKKNNKQYVTFQIESGAAGYQCIADLDNASITYTAANTTATIADAGNGWRRITVTNTSSASIGFFTVWSASGATTTGGGGTYYLWGPDLRYTNQGVGLPVYQRVGAAVAGTSTTAGNADYNANGFPVYLKFDGSNDYMDFPSLAISNQTILFGVQPASAVTAASSSQALLCTTSGDVSVISFGSTTATISNERISWLRVSTAVYGSGQTSEDFAASPYVLTFTYATTPSTAYNRNAVSKTLTNTNAAQPNGGAFTATIYPTNYARIGAREDATLPFNGNLYGLIVRGASSTANQITGAENWLNQKTAAY